MPVIRGTCANGKPILDIVLAPMINAAGVVESNPSMGSFHMTPLKALLDTGADGTSISSSIARSHHLTSLGRRDVIGISGPSRPRTWGIYVGFLFSSNSEFDGEQHTSQSIYAVPDPKIAVEIPPNQWFDVIIGRDILLMYDFYLKRGGEWELTLD